MTLAVRPAPLFPARFTAGPAPAPRTLLDVLATTTAHHPTAAAIDAGGRDSNRLVLGVQWHAEGLIAQPRHRALFDELVSAAAAPAPRLRRAA